LSIRNPYTKWIDLPPYIPDTTHPTNFIAAASHRLGKEYPRGTRKEMRILERYVQSLTKHVFEPHRLHPNEVKSEEEWLIDSPYSAKQRERFRQLSKSKTHVTKQDLEFETFIKWEIYCEPKVPRLINTPSDYIKTKISRFISSLEEKISTLDFLVKHSNPRDWPKRMLELFGMHKVAESDYKAFESLHHGLYARLVCSWLHTMLRAVCTQDELRMIKFMVLGHRQMKSKTVNISVDERLMSGTPWTSIGNAFLNYALSSYLCYRSSEWKDLTPEEAGRRPHRFFTGLVEGDDAIFLFRGDMQPTIKALGLKLEMEIREHFGKAAFCGITCDPDTLQVIYNPLTMMRKFFVLPPDLALRRPSRSLELLRAKALSYMCNFSNVPIVGPLAHAVARRTAHVQPTNALRYFNRWKLHDLHTAIRERAWEKPPDISPSTRLMVAREYGITVSEQLAIEKSFEAAKGPFYLDLTGHQSPTDPAHSQGFFFEDDLPTQHQPPRYVDPTIDALIARRAKTSRRTRACALEVRPHSLRFYNVA
jgi:hypothetical protein